MRGGCSQAACRIGLICAPCASRRAQCQRFATAEAQGLLFVFAGDLARMYQRHAERMGWRTRLLKVM